MSERFFVHPVVWLSVFENITNIPKRQGKNLPVKPIKAVTRVAS